MALGAAAASNVAFGVLTLLVAGAVFGAAPGRRCNRLFAGLLLLRGSLTLANRLSTVVADAAAAAAFQELTGVLTLVFPFAVVAFLVTYRWPDIHRATGPAILTVGVALGIVKTLWPCTYRCTDDGPLALFAAGPALAEAAVALTLVRSIWRHPEGGHRETDWLIANAFMALAVLDGLLVPMLIVGAGGSWAAVFPDSALRTTEHLLLLLAAAAGLMAAALLVLATRRSTRFAGRQAVPIVLAAVAVVTSTIAVVPLRTLDPVETGLFLAGLGRLVLPALAAYGLVRYHLFTASSKVRRGIDGGLVAACFVVTYFVASESTATFIGSQTGNTFVGIAAASLLMVVLVPLERAAQRFTQKAAPSRPGSMDPLAERARFYREHVEIVWSDGQMGRKERLMLDRLRTQLGIPPAEAIALETVALGGPRGGRRRSLPSKGI